MKEKPRKIQSKTRDKILMHRLQNRQKNNKKIKILVENP